MTRRSSGDPAGAPPWWRVTFRDGHRATVVELDPDNRICVEGYDGELRVHRATYSAAAADEMAATLVLFASHARWLR